MRLVVLDDARPGSSLASGDALFVIMEDMLILLFRVKTWQEKSTFLWEPESG